MKRISADQFYAITEDFVLDLIALYGETQKQILTLIAQAQKEGWTPEELIRRIEESI